MREKVTLIKHNSIGGGDIGNALSNLDKSLIGLDGPTIGTAYRDVLSKVQAYYTANPNQRLPETLIGEVGRLGSELSLTLRDAGKTIDAIRNRTHTVKVSGGWMPPTAQHVGAVYSETLVTERMIDTFRDILSFEQQQGNPSQRMSVYKARMDLAVRDIESRFTVNPGEIERIRKYHEFCERMQQEDSRIKASSQPIPNQTIELKEFQPRQAEQYYPEFMLVTASGEVLSVKSKAGQRLPDQYAWAQPAMDRLHKDLAAIRAVAPELLDAFQAEKGELVITQGRSNLYEEHALGITPHEERVLPAGRNQSISYKIQMDAGIERGQVNAVIFPYASYPNVQPMRNHDSTVFFSELNIPAHEIAHQGDRVFTPDVRLGTNEAVGCGHHTYRNLFSLAHTLDSVFEPFGAANSVRIMLNRAGEYGIDVQTHQRETLPRLVENHINNPASDDKSPLLRSYLTGIYLPDMRHKAAGLSQKRQELVVFLDAGTDRILGDVAPMVDRYVKAQNALAEVKKEHGDWSDAYATARKEIADARAALVTNRESIEARFIGYVAEVKAAHYQPPHAIQLPLASATGKPPAPEFKPGEDHGRTGEMHARGRTAVPPVTMPPAFGSLEIPSRNERQLAARVDASGIGQGKPSAWTTQTQTVTVPAPGFSFIVTDPTVTPAPEIKPIVTQTLTAPAPEHNTLQMPQPKPAAPANTITKSIVGATWQSGSVAMQANHLMSGARRALDIDAPAEQRVIGGLQATAALGGRKLGPLGIVVGVAADALETSNILQNEGLKPASKFAGGAVVNTGANFFTAGMAGTATSKLMEMELNGQNPGDFAKNDIDQLNADIKNGKLKPDLSRSYMKRMTSALVKRPYEAVFKHIGPVQIIQGIGDNAAAIQKYFSGKTDASKKEPASAPEISAAKPEITAKTFPNLDRMKRRIGFGDNPDTPKAYTELEAKLKRWENVLDGSVAPENAAEKSLAPPDMLKRNLPFGKGGENPKVTEARANELQSMRGALSELKSYGEQLNAYNAEHKKVTSADSEKEPALKVKTVAELQPEARQKLDTQLAALPPSPGIRGGTNTHIIAAPSTMSAQDTSRNV